MRRGIEIVFLVMVTSCGNSDPDGERDSETSSHDPSAEPAASIDGHDTDELPSDVPPDATDTVQTETNCEELSRCCERLTDERATCELAVAAGNGLTCLAALRTFSACGVEEDPSEEQPMVTPDGWQLFDSWVGNQYAPAMDQMLATSSGTLLGAALDRIWASTDGALTWSEVIRGSDTVYLTSETAGVVYAYSRAGSLYSFVDETSSWERKDAPLDIMSLFAKDAATVYAVIPGGVVVSHDGGGYWDTVPGEVDVGTSDRAHVSMAVDAFDAIHVVFDDELWRKHPSDQAWSMSFLPGNFSGFFSSTDGVFFGLGSEGSIWKSLDYGDTWEQVGIAPSDLSLLPPIQQGLILVHDQEQVHASPDQGATWTALGPESLGPGNEQRLFSATMHDNTLLGSFYQPTFGLSPELVLKPSSDVARPKHYPDSCFNAALDADEARVDCGGPCRACVDWTYIGDFANEPTFVASNGDVFADANVSRDFGASWEPCNQSEEPEMQSVIGEQGGRLYARGVVSLQDSLLISEGDCVWMKLGPSLPGWAHEVVVTSTSEAVVLAAGVGVFTLTDDQEAWSPAFSLPDGHSFSGMLEEPTGAIVIFTHTSDATARHRTEDLAEWQSFDNDQVQYLIEANGELFGTKSDAGIYSSSDYGETWSLVPGTEDVEFGASRFNSSAGLLVSVNSAGTLIIGGDEGTFACKDGTCTNHGPAYRAGLGVALPDDRLLVPPFVSVLTTDW